MNNSMVAHLWANEKQESANGSNFYFEGESIYSYGRHFEVGRIVRNKRGEKAYLINDIYYSSSTSKHQCRVREAIPTGSKVFYVECNISYCIGSDFESVIRMLYSFRNGPKSGIKVADPEDNYEWTNKDGNEKYSTKNLPKAHFRWDWRRYTLSKESVDKITEFVDTILES